MAIISGALGGGGILDTFGTHIKKAGAPIRLQVIQKTALLGTAGISRRVLSRLRRGQT